MFEGKRFGTATICFLCAALLGAWPQELSNLDRGRAKDMLQTVANDVRKHYYDPQFHGVNFDAKIAEAKQQIEKAPSFNMAMSHIAALLDALNDSHTFFVPPEHAYRHDYGFRYQMMGERCFITRVRPHSDAEAKGLKPGDEIITLNGYNVVRDDYLKIRYLFSLLRPQPSLRLTIVSPSGEQRQLDVQAKMRQTQHLTDLTRGVVWEMIHDSLYWQDVLRARYFEVGDQLMVLKVPEFFFSVGEVEAMISKAHKHQNLIIDLRGNPGGSVETLKYLIGGVFDKEVKVADRVGRKEAKPEVAKSIHNPFLGKLIVLVDSDSASAAELFARIIQLEKRGIVMGTTPRVA